MKKATRVKIVKRDGSIEDFQFGKLRRCLAAAMQCCDYDIRYADALARAVSLHLEEWVDPRPPSSDYVFRCIRTVLDETGLSDVATELARHRRQRAVHRRRISIVDDGGGDLRQWSKSDLIATLVERRGMAHGAARILAGEIETRVFAVGFQTMTSRLLEELVRNELLAWGVADGERRGLAAAAAEEIDSTKN